MSAISIDGNVHPLGELTTGTDFYAKNRTIVALRVNGELKDLDTDLTTLPEDAVVEGVELVDAKNQVCQLGIDRGVIVVVLNVLQDAVQLPQILQPDRKSVV